jgi:hypothetical protein
LPIIFSPIIKGRFSPQKREYAVDFGARGNASLNKKPGLVNAAEQMIKMPWTGVHCLMMA